MSYDDSDPLNVGDPPDYALPQTGSLRLWKKDGSATRNPAALPAGDFIPGNGTVISASNLGLSGNPYQATFYLEAVRPSANVADMQIMFEVDLYNDAAFEAMDAVRVTAMCIDVDVDSDNNNALNPPARTIAEDVHEDIAGDTAWPGKFVVVNDDDTDHDFIPDFADGFNRDGLSGTPDEQKDDQTPGESFTPLVIELPAPIDLSKARVKITYADAADPGNVTRTGTSPEHEYAPGSGCVRIWTKDGSQARNKASVGAPAPGDFVPSGTFDASKLGFTGGTTTKTFYLEGTAASTGVAATRLLVEVDPDGDGPAGFILADALRITVIKIDLDARWNSNEATEEVPGTPLLFNNDWDCAQTYPAGAPAPHREKEPIWDNEYDTAQVPAEDDLMKLSIAVAPSTLIGNVTLRITAGAANVRLWPRATKGTAGEIITIPGGGQTYAISTLPKDLYIEGITLGQTVMTLEFNSGTDVYTDTVNIDIVSVENTQTIAGTTMPRVINQYNTDIALQGLPTSLSAAYTYLWDLDGDGTRKAGAWENATTRSVTVKYSAAASGAGNVQLVRNATNRRKEYGLSAILKGGELKGGLAIAKTIRVALDTYEGTAVATTIPTRRTEVAGLTTPPTGFSNTPTQVTSVALTAGGTGYTSAPTVTFTGGGGTGATATATVAGPVTSATVTNGGSGYTSAPTVTFTGGGGTGATASAVMSGSVTAVTVTNGGANYTDPPAVTLVGGGGTGATATAAVAGGSVTGINVTNGGSGYTSAPAVTITGGGGTGATATSTVVTDAVSAINVTNGGTGYTTAPTVAFAGGGGTGAAATATVTTDVVSAIAVTAGGTGYTSAPTVTITGGGGTGATATAAVAHTDPAVTYSQAYFEATFGIEPAPPGTAINAGNRLQYGTYTGFGVTPYQGMGAGREVYIAIVTETAYAAGFKQEDLGSIAQHECRHAQQHIWVAAGGNDWIDVDNAYTSGQQYSNLREADSETVEFNQDPSFGYLQRISYFRQQYGDASSGAILDYNNMAAGAGKTAAKAILQGIYDNIPFIEVKRTGYDWFVRAPQ